MQKSKVVRLSGLALAVAFGACSSPGEETANEAVQSAFANLAQLPSKPMCGAAAAGAARCFGRVRTTNSGAIKADVSPQGLSPSDLLSAYSLKSPAGAGITVGIIDAQDDPNAEADLAVYRTQYGLPACTTANGCFKKVNQRGQASAYPTADEGWAGEIALDLDMVSAACPSCKIVLVEADTADMVNLGASVNMAVSLGAKVISNSYGGDEDGTEAASDAQYFQHAGVSILVSSGDNGYGAQYPASSQYVTAVGGTSLAKSSTSKRGWVEQAWGGSGAGCSSDVAKPSWQKDTGCAKRTVADISAVADPNTGPSTYCSYGSNGGWQVVGGTSVSSPLVAGIYAATGNAGADGSLSYNHASAFYDVSSGTDGTCTPSYLCTAGVGYDGPTGNGTPNAVVLATLGGGMTGGNDGGTTTPTDGGVAHTDGSTGGTCGEMEPNDKSTEANALCADDTQNGAINHAGDVDYYTFAPKLGAKYTVALSERPANFTITIYHLSASGRVTKVASASDPSLASQTISHTSTVGGTYYVAVQGATGTETSASQYHLSVTLE